MNEKLWLWLGIICNMIGCSLTSVLYIEDRFYPSKMNLIQIMTPMICGLAISCALCSAMFIANSLKK